MSMGKEAMIDTIIFDLDGTLLNTLEDLTDSVNYALDQFKLPPRDISEIRRFVGNGANKLIERAVGKRLDDAARQECLKIFKAHYRENMNNKTRPYDDVLDLIRQLLEKGYRLAIVSNKFDKAVKGLNVSYFEGLFPVAIGESETVAPKPAPDSVFEALRQLDSDTSKAIYVGDSDVDVRTAKNAGLPCIGVTWGFRDRDLLVSEGADEIIDSPKELLSILDRRNEVCGII